MANEVTILVTDKYQAGGGFDQAGRRASGFGATMGRVGKSMTAFGAKATTRLTLPLIAGFGLAQQASSNLAEAQNATNVVFGEASGIIDRAAKTSAQSMGLSQRAFREAVTPMGAMLQNLGFSAQEAGTHSVTLAQRAADMASVFNTDVSEALDAINAGLRGEADPLERFGVGLKESAVTAKALEMGLGDTASELTDNQKQQARLALIMEQTDKIAGDFANTSGEAANKQRILKAEAEDSAAAFGQNLQPAMDKLLGTLADLLGWFNQLSPGWQKFIIFAGLALAALGPLVGIIGTLITAIGGVATALTFLAAHPIILAIIALIAVIVLLIVHWDKVKAVAGAAWDFIFGKAKSVFDWLKRNWPLILAILTGPIGLAVLAIVRHWDTIRRGAGAALSWVGRHASNIIGAVVRFFQALPGRVAGAVRRIPGLFYSAMRSAWRTVVDFVNSIVDFIWSIPRRIAGIAGAILDRLPSPGGGIPFIPGIAHGGITGAQGGGPRSGMTMVGEHGIELVDLPAGARVHGNAMTRGILAGAGRATLVVVVNVAGSIRSDRELVGLIRDELGRGGLRGALA